MHRGCPHQRTIRDAKCERATTFFSYKSTYNRPAVQSHRVILGVSFLCSKMPYRPVEYYELAREKLLLAFVESTAAASSTGADCIDHIRTRYQSLVVSNGER